MQKSLNIDRPNNFNYCLNGQAVFSLTERVDNINFDLVEILANNLFNENTFEKLLVFENNSDFLFSLN